MKFIILFACLLAVAYANEEAKVIHEGSEVNHESFKYFYELDNKIKAEQTGSLHDKDVWIVQGFYEYVSPEGYHVKVEYKADDYGYHPTVYKD